MVGLVKLPSKTIWNPTTDPPVAHGAPGFLITASGRIVNEKTHLYVSGTQTGTAPTLPEAPKGDGAKPAPAADAKLPVGVTQALTLLQTGLGQHLPARLAQANRASAAIRQAVGRG